MGLHYLELIMLLTRDSLAFLIITRCEELNAMQLNGRTPSLESNVKVSSHFLTLTKQFAFIGTVGRFNRGYYHEVFSNKRSDEIFLSKEMKNLNLLRIMTVSSGIMILMTICLIFIGRYGKCANRQR